MCDMHNPGLSFNQLATVYGRKRRHCVGSTNLRILFVVPFLIVTGVGKKGVALQWVLLTIFYLNKLA